MTPSLDSNMIEINLTEQEVDALLDEVETWIGIAAEADEDERLRTLTSIQMKLESATARKT